MSYGNFGYNLNQVRVLNVKKNHLPLFFAAGLVIFLVVAACTTQEKANSQETGTEEEGSRRTTLRGTIRIYGNEPHTWVGIMSSEGKIYAVEPPEKAAELRSIQGRLLEFTVIVQSAVVPGIDGEATVLSWRYVQQR